MTNGFEAARGSYNAAAQRKAAKKAARKQAGRQETQYMRVFEPVYGTKFMKLLLKPTNVGYEVEIRYKSEQRVVEYPAQFSPRNFIMPQLIEEAVKLMTKKKKRSNLQVLHEQLNKDKAEKAQEVLQALRDELLIYAAR